MDIYGFFKEELLLGSELVLEEDIDLFLKN
jgi:hypothetical protein